MKNLIVYYLQIFLPLPLIFTSQFNIPNYLGFMLVFYLIYRVFTDYYRLLNKGLMEKNEFYKMFIPFWRIQFFKEMYFEN